MTTMNKFRPWAFWRRLQYGAGFSVFCAGLVTLIYFTNFYVGPSCFDNFQNGDEAGVDCDGSCVRICAASIIPPRVVWADSFAILDGQYNAVAYIENPNKVAATPALDYTFTLYEEGSIIATRSGTTILPPNSTYPIFAGRILTESGRVPTKTEITLAPAEVWQPATTDSSQFVVRDKVLSSPGSRPRLTTRIENVELAEADEVEVVATIFDNSGKPLTASQTIIDNFAPRSTREVVFTWPSSIAKTVRSCEVPTDIIMAIDLSGSMNNDQAEPPEPVSSVLQAAEAFANRLQASDQISVVTFASEAKLEQALSNNASSVASLISTLSIDPKEEQGNTNTGAALELALLEIQSERSNQDARQAVVLLTDGLATAPEEEPENFALAAAAALKAEDITVYTIGLGENVNLDFVRQLASSPALAYQALNKDQVDEIYQRITSSLCEDGPARIDVIPKTATNFTPLR